jgi:hypothetical protein
MNERVKELLCGREGRRPSVETALNFRIPLNPCGSCVSRVGFVAGLQARVPTPFITLSNV